MTLINYLKDLNFYVKEYETLVLDSIIKKMGR